MPDSAKSVVNRGPTRGVEHFTPRLGQRGEEPARFGERVHPGRQRAVPIAGGVVRFDGEDAAIRARDARELAQRLGDVGDVLENGDAEGRVEGRVRKREMAGVGSTERGAQVVAVGRALGDDGALHEPVDADQRNLRHPEARQP